MVGGGGGGYEERNRLGRFGGGGGGGEITVKIQTKIIIASSLYRRTVIGESFPYIGVVGGYISPNRCHAGRVSLY